LSAPPSGEYLSDADNRTLRDLGRSIWTGIERDLLVRIGATVTEAPLVRADAVLRTSAALQA